MYNYTLAITKEGRWAIVSENISESYFKDSFSVTDLLHIS